MRSALITKRNTNHALVGLLAVSVVGMTGVTFGYLWGHFQRPHEYRCPVVEGLKVISTSDSKDGQRCVFVRETYGVARVVMKL